MRQAAQNCWEIALRRAESVQSASSYGRPWTTGVRVRYDSMFLLATMPLARIAAVIGM